MQALRQRVQRKVNKLQKKTEKWFSILTEKIYRDGSKQKYHKSSLELKCALNQDNEHSYKTINKILANQNPAAQENYYSAWTSRIHPKIKLMNTIYINRRSTKAINYCNRCRKSLGNNQHLFMIKLSRKNIP